ncbi:Zn-dependent hydrolase, including glyoxylase [Rubidibacter lacunae KORDI 51-2]|uniref:Zn-dependent hydrolase, including glyoxylase n=1 Tax=Rubidibacter lacunae KORDI 51-2 TaxID=582515 RepID=U5DL72_9CHRO|nr:Zn-dependent hydrolase, including glyoxylase [Rubidibacter lacunae]ERN41324.1 Zn-dependent hydrolase, including glyoxylase [Rubidibacter lacunae KORDI 51-2]
MSVDARPNELLPRPPKPPRRLPEPAGIFAFAPNRETLGATAYLIVGNDSVGDGSRAVGDVLVDCPAWEATNREFLRDRPIRWLFLTHRGAAARVAQWQAELNCAVVVQEQEAYLLPEVETTPFQSEIALELPGLEPCLGLWTCGHTPGSACLYLARAGGVLFSGRHLLPDTRGQVVPLRAAKTFHWWRQLDAVQALRDRFTPETLRYLCPGANTGFLRGRGIVADAYMHLAALDLLALRQGKPGL